MIAAVTVAIAVGLCVASVGRSLGVAAEAPRERTRVPGAIRFAPPRGPFLPLLGGVGGAALGAVIAGVPGLVIVGIAGAVVPVLVERRRATARRILVEEQMLDLVGSLAAAMRAGRSLEQSLALAAAEVDAPLGPTVAAITDRVALGTPLDDSLERWALDLESVEARLVVGVLRLHRRTGGALAGPLDELTSTLRARRAGARELRSLTAQARLSAVILGLLPVGFFLFLSTISRHDIERAVATPAGAGAIGVGLALQGIAFLWIRSLLRVDDA